MLDFLLVLDFLLFSQGHSDVLLLIEVNFLLDVQLLLLGNLLIAELQVRALLILVFLGLRPLIPIIGVIQLIFPFGLLLVPEDLWVEAGFLLGEDVAGLVGRKDLLLRVVGVALKVSAFHYDIIRSIR